MNKLHKFIKMAGCSSEEEFYSKYKDEKDFFKEYPLAKYHTSDGQADVAQNQKMPPDRSVKNEFRNAKEEKRSVPKSSEYKKGGCHDCDMMKYQVGGNFPAGNIFTDNYAHIFDEQGQMSFTPDTRPTPAISTEYYQRRMVPNSVTGVGEMQQVRVASQADPSAHYGTNQSPAYNYGPTQDYSVGNYSNSVATSGAALGSENYSIDRVREQNMRMGGYLRKYQPGGNFGPTGNPIDDNYTPDIIGTPPPSKVYPTDTGVVQQRPPAPWMKKKNGTYMDSDQAIANINYGEGSVEAYNPRTGNTQAPKQGANPWMVGAGILGAGVGAGIGAFAGYSAIQNNLEKQSNFANYQREQGLTSNVYQARNPQGSQGDFGQVGQAYGMFRPNQQIPSKGGNRFAKNGGHGTWDGAMGVYFQEGGQAGFERGNVMDLSPAQIQAMTKKGYRFEIID